MKRFSDPTVLGTPLFPGQVVLVSTQPPSKSGYIPILPKLALTGSLSIDGLYRLYKPTNEPYSVQLLGLRLNQEEIALLRKRNQTMGLLLDIGVFLDYVLDNIPQYETRKEEMVNKLALQEPNCEGRASIKVWHSILQDCVTKVQVKKGKASASVRVTRGTSSNEPL